MKCRYSPTGAATNGGWCAAESVALIVAGCVHEHMLDAYVCADHYAQVLSVAEGGKANCFPCKRAGCVGCKVQLISAEPALAASSSAGGERNE